MNKEEIMKALNDDELKKKLLEELEIEELEERSVPSRIWMCYCPLPR
jgi:hypothetical protein